MLTSGALTARVRAGADWRLDFLAGGRLLTAQRREAPPRSSTPPTAGTTCASSSTSASDTAVYGLGERFGPLVKNGQVVDIWNADGGTSSEQAYKNVPFYLTNAGYGVFVNHPGRVSFEVASETVSRVQFSVPGQSLEYFVIYGPTPQAILRKYTALTGRPPRCPGLVVRPVADHLVHHVLRRGDGHQLRRRDGRARTCRCRSSTSTRSGCASSTGATSSGTRGRSPTRRACWPG